MVVMEYTYKEHILQKQEEAEKAFLAKFNEGSYTIDEPLVIPNPYLIAPLTALVMFRTSEPRSVKLEVKGKEEAGTIHAEFPEATEHVIPVYGLYAGYVNTVTIELSDGRVKDISIETEEVPSDLKRPEYIRTTSEYFGENMMFESTSSLSKLAAYDYAGDIRWYITIEVVFEIKRVSNGRIWVATDRLISLPYYVTGIYEMGMIGKIYREYRIPGGTHHDYIEGKNQDLVILGEDPNRDSTEDVCRILDRETGELKDLIDLKAIVPPDAAAGNRKSTYDWFHNNAVWFDEASNSLTFSGRNLDALVNLDYDTHEINWILGDPDKWPQDYVDKYFFTPEPDQDDFDWFYAQHSCSILPNDDVFVFDNGAWRSKFPEKDIPADQKFSRGVIYRINKENRTVRQVYQYGKERGSEFFSPHISNVIYYGPGHYLIHSGDIGNIAGVPCVKPPIFYLNKPEEKDLTYYSLTTEVLDGEVVYEIKIPSTALYRARKLPLYDAHDVLAFGPGYQLGSLGATQQSMLKVKDATEPLPNSFGAKLAEEIDRFSFTILLPAGTYAALVLKGEDSRGIYTIPTAEKDALTMCVGAFQPDDANECILTVSKEGLKGVYDMLVMIEGTWYSLDHRMTVE